MVIVRPLVETDHPWVSGLVVRYFGSVDVVSRGVQHDALRLPGLMATEDGGPVGLLLYQIVQDACEVVIIAAATPRRGVGKALLQAACQVAQHAGCTRLWLVTSNDNRRAQAFYQAQGMRLVAIHHGAITQARVLKPEIPWLGENGIPLEDEIEYELVLERA